MNRIFGKKKAEVPHGRSGHEGSEPGCKQGLPLSLLSSLPQRNSNPKINPAQGHQPTMQDYAAPVRSRVLAFPEHLALALFARAASAAGAELINSSTSMVKPLNKEWELFGPKYRVAGAKGDKVNCNACQKQVSAAVNRLQSHLRVCPARPALATVMNENADALLKQQLKQQQQHPDAFGGQCADTSHAMVIEDNHHHVDSIGDGADLTAAALDSTGGAAFSAASQTFLSTGSAPQTAAGAGAAVVMVSAEPDTGAGATISAAPVESAHLTVSAAGMAAAATAVTGTTAPPTGAPAAKRHKTSPTRTKERPRWSNTSTTVSSANNSAAIAVMDDFWLSGTPHQSSSSSSPASSSAYAKRRLELEEKRLLLEMKKDQREERRELYHLEILEAQARKERLAAEKEAYEGKVLLALSRKQLRDQGVSEDEVDRILPVENNSNTVTAAAAAKSYATPVADTENES